MVVVYVFCVNAGGRSSPSFTVTVMNVLVENEGDPWSYNIINMNKLTAIEIA